MYIYLGKVKHRNSLYHLYLHKFFVLSSTTVKDVGRSVMLTRWAIIKIMLLISTLLSLGFEVHKVSILVDVTIEEI